MCIRLLRSSLTDHGGNGDVQGATCLGKYGMFLQL